MIVLDTNVISELMKEAPTYAVRRWSTANNRAIVINTVCAAELLAGAHRLPDGYRKRDLLDRTDRVLVDASTTGRLWPFDHDAANEYGILSGECRRAGRPRPLADLMIAAICRSREAALATRNVNDFEGLGIDVINPWEG